MNNLKKSAEFQKKKILEAIEQALAAAYKKDYGKKGQIIRASFDQSSGKTEFSQVKIVVDDSTVRMVEESEEEDTTPKEPKEGAEGEEEQDLRPRFNPEHHILLEDARKIKKDAALDEEIVFLWNQRTITDALRRKPQSRLSSKRSEKQRRFRLWANIRGRKGKW